MMQVKLKVLRGASAGKELAIRGPKFVIGRSEKCHLRPHSDAVSREHCAFIVTDDSVALQDMGSRNGTYLNGERLEGTQELNLGDHIQIGPLEFEVTVTRPKRVEQKVSTSRASEGSSVDGMINDWLDEADSKAENKKVHGQTRQYRFDDAERSAMEDTSAAASASTPTEVNDADPKDGKSSDTGKANFQVKKETAKDSQEAASQTLKKLFNRGAGR